MKTIGIFFKNYWKSIFIFCLIFYVSILHKPSGQTLKFPHQDKLVHLIMYFALSSILFRDMVRVKSLYSKSHFLLVVLAFPIVYGVVIEILQGAYVPNRTADIYDIVSNIIGSVIAFLIAPYLLKRKN